MKLFRFYYTSTPPKTIANPVVQRKSCIFTCRKVFEYFLEHWTRGGWTYHESPEDLILNRISSDVPLEWREDESSITGEIAYLGMDPAFAEYVRVSDTDKVVEYVVCGRDEAYVRQILIGFPGHSASLLEEIAARYGHFIAANAAAFIKRI